MREKRRNGRASTKTSIEDEIAHLRGLDLKGLRARWQSVFQRPAPDHLPRHLQFAIIAYRIQGDRFGDLDHETRQVLDRADAKDTGAVMSARLVSFDQKRTELTPGTVLVREWDRQSQRERLNRFGLFNLLGENQPSFSRRSELFALQPVTCGFHHFAVGDFPTFGCGQQGHDFFAFSPSSLALYYSIP